MIYAVEIVGIIEKVVIHQNCLLDARRGRYDGIRGAIGKYVVDDRITIIRGGGYASIRVIEGVAKDNSSIVCRFVYGLWDIIEDVKQDRSAISSTFIDGNRTGFRYVVNIIEKNIVVR